MLAPKRGGGFVECGRIDDEGRREGAGGGGSFRAHASPLFLYISNLL